MPNWFLDKTCKKRCKIEKLNIKTLCWLLCTNLQNKTHYRRVTPFARLQKSQHKYIVSNSSWKLSPIINIQGGWVERECSGWKKTEKLISGRLEGEERLLGVSRVGTKFCLKMTLMNFWIKLTQKEYFGIKKDLSYTIIILNYHRILQIQINLDSTFELQQTILIFGTTFQNKVYFQLKTQKYERYY